MRILYFTRDYTPHDFRFLNSLAKTEHEVYSLRLMQRNYQVEERVLPPEVHQVAWPGSGPVLHVWDYPRLVWDLKRVIAEVKPDLIHAGTIQTAAFIAALSGFTPLVSMSWGSDLLRDADRSPWMQWMTRFTLHHSRILIGDCQAVRTKATHFGYPAKKVILFPWGIDLQQFSPAPEPALRERLGWQETFVVLSLRSWEPVYGVEIVLQAFIEAARKHPQLRLLLLGNGSEASYLKQLIQDSGLADRIHLGGVVSQADLPSYYRAADLYVSASHSDGSSVSLMEALGCGRAVAVSDIAGNKEWITPGREGWLFADGNAQELANCIEQAVLHPEQVKSMEQAARWLAERHANWTVNFQQLLKAYSMAVQAGQ